MRVIAGTLRHRKLKEVLNDVTKSTKDRVKESMFNAITPCAQYGQVLDLFAGSGALGIEALSRGSNRAVFVEKNSEPFMVLKDNIKTLDLEARSDCLQQDALRYITTTKTVFDLILIDPPYRTIDMTELLNTIIKYNVLSQHGRIIVLTDNKASITCHKPLKVIKQKSMGLTMVSHIEWSDIHG